MTRQTRRTCRTILDALLELDVVSRGRIWDRIPGRERVYIDLVSRDGGPVGHSMYIDVHTGFTCYDKQRKWAGPNTQAFHRSAKTRQQVQRIVSEHVRPKLDPVRGAVLRAMGELA